MSYATPFTSVGCLTRKTIRTSPLMYSMICFLKNNKKCLKKGILVTNIKLNCSKSSSNKIRNTMVNGIINQNVSTNLLKKTLEICHWRRRVKRRKPIVIMEKLDMLRKPIERRWRKWKRRSRTLRKVCQLVFWSTNLLKTSPYLLELPRICIPILLIQNG